MTTADRWAWAAIDLDAITHNVGVIREMVQPSAVWAVVKANGYGHGAVDVAACALDAGAEGLCVALVAEGVALRDAGITSPILVLSEQPIAQIPTIIAYQLTPTVYTVAYIEALGSAAVTELGVHLKVDTGMQRVGADPDDVSNLLAVIASYTPTIRLAGVFTHLAVADDPLLSATTDQLEQFDRVLSGCPLPESRLGEDGGVLVHAANSAGALGHPDARRSLVRLGIALYGISPGIGVDHLVGELRPALSLHARVSFVKRVAAGSSVSYGWRHTFAGDTTVATIPIGYADGVARRLSSTGGEVLIGGIRRAIVGAITMDQLVVDVGDDIVIVGDEVVLIGEQGGECIRAQEWADRLGTIGYEIVTGISNRVPRVVRSSLDG